MTDKEFWKGIAARWSSTPRSFDDYGESAIRRWLAEDDKKAQKKYKKNFLEEEDDDDDW